MEMTRQHFEKSIYERSPEAVTGRLADLTIGIAGAGGLGSNVAAALVRCGAARLIIADFDRVEYSNLNRQFYFTDQVGHPKVEALRENLLRINPFTDIILRQQRVAPDNIRELFHEADIMVEAFDTAEDKTMLIHGWAAMYPERYIITAAGLSGFGASRQMRVRRCGKVVVCGDGHSTPDEGLTAPRVALAAALQANCVVEIAVTGRVAC
jgi:sulfur carrier protein ThiS adenylyltransferase